MGPSLETPVKMWLCAGSRCCRCPRLWKHILHMLLGHGGGYDNGHPSLLCSVWTTLDQTKHKIPNKASIPIYTNVIKANMKFSFNFSGSKECVLPVELNFLSIDNRLQTFQTLLIIILHHNNELGIATIFSNSLFESISKWLSRLHQE